MNLIPLKPCPCCGGEAKYEHDIGIFIECSDCWLRTCRVYYPTIYKVEQFHGKMGRDEYSEISQIMTKNKAAEYWNRRTHEID